MRPGSLTLKELRGKHTAEKLVGVLSMLKPQKILVLGDFLLDMYTTGQVGRISPEAPVSILKVNKENYLPGGAGNVVLNLLSLGNQVISVGRVGEGFAANELINQLKSEDLDTSAMLPQKGYLTPLKNRLISSGQQLIRIDHEEKVELDPSTEKNLILSAIEALSKVDVVAISDYGKGGLTKTLIQTVIKEAKKRSIPVVIDPKSADFSIYNGASLVKPNQKEAYLASGLPESATLSEVADAIFKRAPEIENLIITRAKDGISWFSGDRTRHDFPVKASEVQDVTGAGDCVLAAITQAIGCKLGLDVACALANVAGAIAIKKVGCVQIELKDLSESLLKTDVHNKIFKENQLFAMQEVLRDRSSVLFALVGEDSFDLKALLRLQKEIKHLEKEQVLVFISQDEAHEELIDLLISVTNIDFLILEEDSLRHFASQIDPDRVLSWNGAKFVDVEGIHGLLKA